MRASVAIFISAVFLFFGVLNISRQKNKTRALEEAVRFISEIKNGVRFKNLDFDGMCSMLLSGSFPYLKISESEIVLSDFADKRARLIFKEFSGGLGRTDKEGQLLLCDEYSEKLKHLLARQLNKESERVQISASLSILGALCAFIFFV